MQKALKFLIDTNILISVEPTSVDDVEPGTSSAITLINGLHEGQHDIFCHPETLVDLDKDRDEKRQVLRKNLTGKYRVLPSPPSITPQFEAIVGSAERGSNDWVDNHMLIALNSNAVDILVTEDKGIHKKARRLTLQERVMNVAEAVDFVFKLLPTEVLPPPAVDKVKAHNFDIDDPIFRSFRDDYQGFDDWFQKVQADHRDAWCIQGDEGLAGVAIVKGESEAFGLIQGKILKICSFKISEDYNGYLFGELLLRAIFDHVLSNEFEWSYVTVFEKHELLCQRFEDFGFERQSQLTPLGELIFIKALIPPAEPGAEYTPLHYHVKYGPKAFLANGVKHFLVPIRPTFSNRLFPDTVTQTELFPGVESCGNGIRKAYLCNSPIRKIEPGSVLYFYRSLSGQSLIAAGVVEKVEISADPEQIVNFVTRRTVYSLDEIAQLCAKDVLVLLFREVIGYPMPVSKDLLEKNEVFKRAPQSIMEIDGGGLKWLTSHLGIS